MKLSIKEIANMANVSKATVSRVINDKPDVSDKTREKIFKIMKEMDYTPNEHARNLSLGIVKTVALIVPSDNPMYIDIVRRINKKLFENNMDLLFYITNHSQDTEKKQLKELKTKNLAGLIYIKSEESDNSTLELLSDLKIPIVIMSNDDIKTDYDQLYIDEIELSYNAAKCLVEEGHTKIAFLSTPLNLNYEKKRYKGALKAMENKKDCLNNFKCYFANEVTIEQGKKLAEKIFNDGYSVICSLSNILTLGVIKYLNEVGKNINDISIVSFGHLDLLNKVGYNISTVWLSNQKISESAVKLIINRIEKPKSKIKKISLKPYIVLRGSEKKD